MEHDRFDDVEFRITEAPEPPPRRGRWVVAGAATLVATGMLAAGAWALTSPGSSEPVAQPAPKIHYNADGVPVSRHGRECMAGKGHHGARHSERDSSVKY
jgi:hypothetical protein